MACDFGMSDRLGPIMFSRKQHSEATAKAIDEEGQAIVPRNHECPKALLVENGQFLETLAKELEERESKNGSS